MSRSGVIMTPLATIMHFRFCSFKVAHHLCAMNETFTTERQREWARQLYLHEGATIKDIFLKTGAPETDIRRWVAEGSWEGLKRSLLTSKEFQLTQLYKLLEQLTDKMQANDEVTTKDADLLVKYTAAIKNLDTEIDIPAITQVAKQFTTWLRRKNLELAQQVTVQFDGFIKQRLAPVFD